MRLSRRTCWAPQSWTSMLSPKGAFLNVIAPNGSAARAGLLGGDVITAVDGKPVSNAASLQKAMAAHRAGDKLAIDAVHLGKPDHFTLVLVAASAAKPQMTAAAPARPAPAAESSPAHAANAAGSAQMRWTKFTIRPSMPSPLKCRRAGASAAAPSAGIRLIFLWRFRRCRRMVRSPYFTAIPISRFIRCPMPAPQSRDFAKARFSPWARGFKPS